MAPANVTARHEDFCIVAQSIRPGINVHASVIAALVDEIADEASGLA